ncbi:hypothetical protein E2C01_097573 [Portunus trituberculatus]|uniref:Uncharacterized protein n=1 Tax=Portunus trituberculatus TaxID=210409 RepID=A0A5B7K9Z5_PORTR|nr:hypothetical protein [Portunus trituberculatus]
MTALRDSLARPLDLELRCYGEVKENIGEQRIGWGGSRKGCFKGPKDTLKQGRRKRYWLAGRYRTSRRDLADERWSVADQRHVDKTRF